MPADLRFQNSRLEGDGCRKLSAQAGSGSSQCAAQTVASSRLMKFALETK